MVQHGTDRIPFPTDSSELGASLLPFVLPSHQVLAGEGSHGPVQPVGKGPLDHLNGFLAGLTAVQVCAVVTGQVGPYCLGSLTQGFGLLSLFVGQGIASKIYTVDFVTGNVSRLLYSHRRETPNGVFPSPPVRCPVFDLPASGAIAQ